MLYAYIQLCVIIGQCVVYVKAILLNANTGTNFSSYTN